MRFFRVFVFITLLLFSLNVTAQTANRALTVKGVEVNKTLGSVSESSGGWRKGLAATAGVVLAGTLLAFTGIGLIGAAILGYGAYKTLSPEESSFGKILNAFNSLDNGSWFSSPFNTIFNSINELAISTNYRSGASGTNMASACLTILALLMAFYIVYTAAKAIISFKPIELGKLVSDIFFPIIRCIIAVICIKYWQYIFDAVITPLLSLAINFGVKIQQSIQTTSSYSASVSNGVEMVTAHCTLKTPGQGLGIEVCNALQTFLATVSYNLIVWMALGATFVADCWGNGLWNVLPSIKMLSTGLIVFVFTFMVYVKFPLQLLDAMFRLMFVVALFPIWCIFWVLQPTRKYFENAVKMFINVAATFICASVVMVMIISILGSLFNGINVDEVTGLLLEGKAEKAMEKIGFTTSALFYSTCLLFMASHLVGKIDYFTNMFEKQESMKIGEAMGAKTTGVMMATATKGPRMINNAGKWAGHKAMAVGKWGADKVKGGINRFQAKRYNANAPGSKKKDGSPARQSPRFWTAAVPGTGLWDSHKAKKAIGGYARTQDVTVGKKEKFKDGSTQQTYSNRTVDKKGNTLAQMSETTSSNKDKSKQSVDRSVTHFDNLGDVRRTANVKKDFQNGSAIRKTTTMMGKDGSKVNLLVDKTKGIASSVKFGADGKKISETMRDLKTGMKTVTSYGADGKKLSTVVSNAATGVKAVTKFGANGQKLSTETTNNKKGMKVLTNFGADGSKSTEVIGAGKDGSTRTFTKFGTNGHRQSREVDYGKSGKEVTTFDGEGKAQQTVSDHKTAAGGTHHEVRNYTNATTNIEDRDASGNVTFKQTEMRASDGRKIQHTVDNENGINRTTAFDKDDHSVLSSQETDSHTGNTTTKHYDPDSHKLETEEVRGRDGSSSTTTHHENGDVEKVVRDADGAERGRSWTHSDGSKETVRYSKEKLADGRFAGFETIDKDASGKITKNIKVDLKNDSYTDRLSGATGKWSDFIKKK